MGKDRVSDNDAIDGALHLDGDPRNLHQYYESWAGNYDADVSSSDYSGPAGAARLLAENIPAGPARLLDAGCGTGLVGVELAALGYSGIDGFDLSEAMARRAEGSGCYRQVLGGIDMMRAAETYPKANYDAVLSIGVFTLGHVPPDALEVLTGLARPGGLLLLSTRTHYYEQTDFGRLVEQMQSAGLLELRQCLRDAPYNHDGDAHYWVFEKSGA